MKPKEDILFSWTSPKELIPTTSSLIKRSLKVSFITFLVIICVLITLYISVKIKLPQDSDVNWEKTFFGIAAAMTVVTLIGSVMIALGNRDNHISKYHVDNKGIHHNSQLSAWKKIAGFHHKPNDEHPDITVVSIFIKLLFTQYRPVTLYLGEDTPVDDIIETLSQRLPLLQDPDVAFKETRLLKPQRAVMWCIVALYSTAIVSSPFLFKYLFNGNNIIWYMYTCLLFTFFVGPGKLCQPLFFRKGKPITPIHRFYIHRHASLYNSVAIASFYIIGFAMPFIPL